MQLQQPVTESTELMAEYSDTKRTGYIKTS